MVPLTWYLTLSAFVFSAGLFASLARRNAIGLLSEDLAPATGELWGNFPQTYSHVGLINCAMRLSRDWDDIV